MKSRIPFVLLLGCLCLLPLDAFAHHMGRGYGSAPEAVDDYAHGVNAVKSGFAMNAAENGAVNTMQGAQSNRAGGPDNSYGTVNAEQAMQGDMNHEGTQAAGIHGEEASAAAGDNGAGGGDGGSGSGGSGGGGSGGGGSGGGGSGGGRN